MSHSNHDVSAQPKRRLRFYIPFIVLLCLAAGGIWATLQYARTGEIAIPMPDQGVEVVAKVLDLDENNRYGPFRFGEPKPDEPADDTPQQPANVAGGKLVVPQEAVPEEDPDVIPPDQILSSPQLPTMPGEGRQPGTPPDAQSGGQASGSGTYLAPRQPQEIPPAPVVVTENQRPRPAPTPAPDAGTTVTAPLSQPKPDEGGQPSDSGPGQGAGQQPDAQASTPPPDQAGSTRGVPLEDPALLPGRASATRPGAVVPRRAKIYEGEDSMVTMGFIEDLAQYLAENYWPAGSHPAAKNYAISTAGVRSANQRYGIDLKGFAGGGASTRDYYRDRSLVLNYVFMPSMVQALTNLYVERFVDALAEAGRNPLQTGDSRTRTLTPAQNAAMLDYYATAARAVGAAMLAYASSSDAQSLVNAYNRAERESYAAHTRLLDSRLAHELALESGDRDRISAAESDLQRQEKVYQTCRAKQKSTENDIGKMMSKSGPQRLNQDSLVYIACWLARRGADNNDAILSAASSSDFVARVLNEKAVELRSGRR